MENEQRKERDVQYSKRYYETHKEQKAHYAKTYYATHKEQKSRYRAEYEEANKEQLTQYRKEYQQANREQKRVYKLAKRYGLTAKMWTFLYQQQRGVCAICDKPFADNDCVVDHCHVTGKVRGLLCRRCNAGLGQFDDCADRVLKVHQYLSNLEG